MERWDGHSLKDIPMHSDSLLFPCVPAETPECKAKSTVRVKADGNLPRGVQFTLELDGSTESIDRRVGHLEGKEHGTGWNWHPTGKRSSSNDRFEKRPFPPAPQNDMYLLLLQNA